MATDLETLVVSLEARVKGYESALRKATGVADQRAREIERRFDAASTRISSSFEGIGSAASRGLAAIGVGLGAREIQTLADTFTRANNVLKVSGVSAADLGTIFESLYQTAQKYGTSLEPVVTLYGRGSQAAKELGASQQDLLKFTEGVSAALKVQGVSSAAASGALLQLSQLLGSGTVHAEEFNSVNESARPILQAVANNLDAAGGSVAKLKTLVNEGAVSSRDFFQAFQKGIPDLITQASQAATTISQAFTQVENALTKYIGQSDSSLGATQRIAQALGALAQNFDTVANAVIILAVAFGSRLAVSSVAAAAASSGLSAAIMRQVAAFRIAAAISGSYGTALSAMASRATVAATAMGVLRGGLALVGGPVGAVITGLSLAFLYVGQRTQEATEYSKLYAAALDDIKGKAKEAGDASKDAATQFVETQRESLTRTINEATRQLQDARSELTNALAGQVTPDFLAGFVGAGREVNDQWKDILQKFKEGKLSAAEVREELAGMANSGLPNLIPQFDDLINRAAAAAKVVSDLKSRLDSLGNGPALSESISPVANNPQVKQLGAQFFSQGVIEDSQKSTEQKQLEARTQTLLNDAKKKGIDLSEQQAQQTAKQAIANENAVKTSEKAARSSSGSGTSRKSPDDRFDRSLDGTREQIAQLEAERAGLSQTTEAREKAAETVKLYADAKRAGLAVDKEGIPVDATVRQRVDELSTAYGRAAQALDDARQKQQQFGELQQFIGDNLSSFFSDIVTGSATVEDSLKRIVSALGDAALQAALLGQGPLAGLFGTSGTGGKTGGLIGALSGLFGGSGGGGASIAGGSGGLYAFGGYTGPGGKFQPAGVVHKGEYVFDAAATRRLGIGNLEALRRGYANGGYVGAMGIPKMPTIPSAAARQGGSGGLNVVVNNHSDSQVTTRESKGPGGTKQLEVMVEQVIQKSLSRNGPVARQLQGTYGLNRMGGRR
jgi:tape measure domain-containing protein